ncbi:MAG: 16S rRNA (guanine966-N2)-methyltransferase [Bacteroidia bacterium]
MRIIAGKYRGLQIPLPKNGEIRPTTDRAKEALFNYLTHQLSFEETSVCDLFSGSGNMSFEFASRGSMEVTGVEQNARVVKQLMDLAKRSLVKEVQFVKSDAFTFIAECNENFHIVFADPPYDHPRLKELPKLVLDHKLVKMGGCFILERPTTSQAVNEGLSETRIYGQSAFDIYWVD